LTTDGNPALRDLWARTRIAELSHAPRSGLDDEARKEITRLGLEYSLLTRYTSFVAVDRVVRNPGGSGSDADQPLPLPAGVEDSAVGGPMQVGAEPELWLLAMAMLGMLAARAMLRRAPWGGRRAQ
jgi:Ca-activated chloride channel family protein